MSDPNVVFRQAGEAMARGDAAGAVALYRALLVKFPDHPLILTALGNGEIALGAVEQGVTSLQRSLLVSEGQPDAWCNLARGLRLLQRPGEALAAVDRALSLRPDLFEAWMARGNILWDLDRNDEALKAYERACLLRPRDARPYFNCGNTLQRLGRLELAAGAYALAVKYAPQHFQAHLARAKVLDLLAHHQDALDAADRAAALRPDDSEPQFTRGVILASLERLDDAIAAFTGAIDRDPSRADAYRWRGLTHQKLWHAAESVADLDRALALQPDYVEAEFDRAVSLQELLRYDEAIAAYDRVLAQVPDYALAEWNRSLLHLALGDFAAGWRGYEARWRRDTDEKIPETPRWTGEDPSGKTILVWSEQGFGDCVQFLRYVPMLAARGARVIVETYPLLVPLVRSLAGVAAVIDRGGPRPPHDLNCPVMSLPRAFGTTLETIPAAVPYLAADPAKTLALEPGRHIGLAWAGSPTHARDIKRSLPLAALAPVLVRTATYHSLQKDHRAEDAAALAHFGVHLHTDDIADFAGTAALIAAMDVVVTVDTVIAHLAGALGKKVFVLVPQVPDWRWLLDRSDSPWYPTMHLFRQAAADDWTGAIAAVADALDR